MIKVSATILSLIWAGFASASDVTAGGSCANTTKCDSGFTCQVNENGVDVCVPDDQVISPLLDLNDLPVPTLYAYDFSGIISTCPNSSTLVCDPGTVCQDDGSGNETCVSPIYYSILDHMTIPDFPTGGDNTTDCANTTTLVCDAGSMCKVDATGYEACVYPIVYDKVPLLPPIPVIAEPTSASTMDSSATTIAVSTPDSNGGFVCNLFCIQGYECVPDIMGKATCVPEGSSSNPTTPDDSGGFVCNLLCIQGYKCVPDSMGKATCVPEGSSPNATIPDNSGGFVCNLFCIQGYECGHDSTGKATCVPKVSSPNATTPDISGEFVCTLFCIQGYMCAPDSTGKATCVPATSVPEPEWLSGGKKHVRGARLKKCHDQRNGAPPMTGQTCSKKKEKTCFHGTKLCPDGVGPRPTTRCVCKGTWSCSDVACP